MQESENTNVEEQKHMHPSFLKVLEKRRVIQQKLAGIKHIIGIYSAKGGVGKTTTAVNIAYTLGTMGFKVGLLDADIDCPNVTMFLGIEDVKMEIKAFPIKPVEVHGIKVMSTAIVVDELKRPIIWRGPLVTKMVEELLENTEWGDLDYLIIDLPPGTSDVPLTIMQLLKGVFVIVTTPQRIASLNSIRSGLMAKRMNSAILGVVENMSSGKASPGTISVLAELKTELLGTIKLSTSFNDHSDSGRIISMHDKEVATEYRKIAEQLG